MHASIRKPLQEDRVSVVELEVSAGIGTIRVDRPPMNALDTEVYLLIAP